jgi:hypothetical protein
MEQIELGGTSSANFDKPDLAPDAAVRDAAAASCAGPGRPLPFWFRVLDCRGGKPGSADLGRAVLFKRFCHCPVLKFD